MNTLIVDDGRVEKLVTRLHNEYLREHYGNDGGFKYYLEFRTGLRPKRFVSTNIYDNRREVVAFEVIDEARYTMFLLQYE